MTTAGNEVAQDDPIDALAELITSSTDARRGTVTAEYELFLMAGRRSRLQDEYTRWLDTLERFLTPHITDPQRRASASVAVEGSVHALLRQAPMPLS